MLPAGVFNVTASLSNGVCSMTWDCAACVLTDQTAFVTFTLNETTAQGLQWLVGTSSYDKDVPSTVSRTEIAPLGYRFGGTKNPTNIRTFDLLQKISFLHRVVSLCDAFF